MRKNRKNITQTRNRKKRRLIHVMARIVMAELFLLTAIFIFVTKKESLADSPDNIHLELEDHITNEYAKVNLRELYSPHAVLMDLSDGRILAEHNSQEKIYPASLTKIMTAILAIENTDSLDDTAVIPVSIFNELYSEGASMAGFEAGEEVKIKDLLYGVLLPSGAECCMTFAERIAGSEEAFAEMMNRKAKELGMANTHFCNATGLQNANHFSTVEDIAVLLKYALQNDVFREVFVSESYRTEPTNYHLDGITFYSTMFQELDSTDFPGGTILGGKTGYTKKAGLCLASLAEIGGKEYILVTAGANGSHETEPFHVLDAIKVYKALSVT